MIMITVLLVPVSQLAIAILPFFNFIYFNICQPGRYKQYVNVNLVCIFMTTSALKHLLIYLWAVRICSCELHIHILCLFSIELSFLSNCKSSLCIIVINLC